MRKKGPEFLKAIVSNRYFLFEKHLGYLKEPTDVGVLYGIHGLSFGPEVPFLWDETQPRIGARVGAPTWPSLFSL
jgi:hypothetical protein